MESYMKTYKALIESFVVEEALPTPPKSLDMKYLNKLDMMLSKMKAKASPMKKQEINSLIDDIEYLKDEGITDSEQLSKDIERFNDMFDDTTRAADELKIMKDLLIMANKTDNKNADDAFVFAERAGGRDSMLYVLKPYGRKLAYASGLVNNLATLKSNFDDGVSSSQKREFDLLLKKYKKTINDSKTKTKSEKAYRFYL